MAGIAAAHLPVAGVRHRSARIAALDVRNANHVVEDRFGAPEAPARQCRLFFGHVFPLSSLFSPDRPLVPRLLWGRGCRLLLTFGYAFLGAGQGEGEDGAPTLPVFRPDLAVMGLHDRPADRQAD